jgi:hypothetical protein
MAAATAHVTIKITPEMISQYLWERDHLIRRGTIDYGLVLDIIRSKTHVLDEHTRRINGRYIKVAFIQFDEQGRPAIDDGDFIIAKWKRVRIPKNHPWRGVRPTQ